MLITGVITACSCNTLKPKALPRRARGELDKSCSSLLLDLAKHNRLISQNRSNNIELFIIHVYILLY